MFKAAIVTTATTRFPLGHTFSAAACSRPCCLLFLIIIIQFIGLSFRPMFRHYRVLPKPEGGFYIAVDKPVSIARIKFSPHRNNCSNTNIVSLELCSQTSVWTQTMQYLGGKKRSFKVTAKIIIVDCKVMQWKKIYTLVFFVVVVDLQI